MQLGPNGKLYVSCFAGGAKYIHVINKPDEKGDSCNFVWAGQPSLSQNNVNLPHLINYKLGPLVSSGCDTIADITVNPFLNERDLLRILPNPANKYAYVEMRRQGEFIFELINEAGQVLDTKQTRQVDIFDTEKLPTGAYYMRVSDKQNPNYSATKKLMVVH